MVGLHTSCVVQNPVAVAKTNTRYLVYIYLYLYILPFIEKTTTETVIGLRHGGAGDGGEGI